MFQVAIDSEILEGYFKTQDEVKDFLELAFQFDLLNIVKDIEGDEAHQKTLLDIKSGNVKFYDDTKELIKALNE